MSGNARNDKMTAAFIIAAVLILTPALGMLPYFFNLELGALNSVNVSMLVGIGVFAITATLGKLLYDALTSSNSPKPKSTDAVKGYGSASSHEPSRRPLTTMYDLSQSDEAVAKASRSNSTSNRPDSSSKP